MDELKIHELSLQFPHDKEMLIRFLNRNGLVFEEDIEAAYGIFTPEDELAGCGCCAGNLLKCFAVDERLRGQNALGSLISRLTENRFAAGYYDLFVITRPENRVLFTSCGFYPLAETQSVLMLENKKNGLDSYYKKFEADGARLKSGAMNDGVGCIVMNCNPFTKGHQELITYAASKCSLLHIFVVEENRSMFPFADRFRLVREGTDHIPNVLVHPSGPYMISNATFPTYFLKKGEDAARIQSELDITLDDCRLDYDGWGSAVDRHALNLQGQLTLGTFRLERRSRRANHIIGLLDKWTVYDRVSRDDATVVQALDSFTLAQVTELINLAIEHQCTNCTAALLAYKNDHFSNFDPMDVFTLE